jgi:serine/threonine protein kinase
VYFGIEGDFVVMVIQILGPDLSRLFEFCDRKFDFKTIMMIAIQGLERIEFLHSKNYLHRDLKPENFCIGAGKKADTFYLIDLGLAKRFICPSSGKHLTAKRKNCCVGTKDFMSLNAHTMHEQSRADDLEAFGFILFYFLHNG